MTRALPTSGLVRFDRSDRTTIISLPSDMGIKPNPERVQVAIDCGSLWWKIAILQEIGGISQITIYRVLNFLVEKGRSSLLNDEDINFRGKTYALDEKGAYLGGESKLRGNKMDGLHLRLMAALNYIGLGNAEDIDLSITTFFEKGLFKKRQMEAIKHLSAPLTWSNSSGKRSVKIANLKVYPEGYHLAFYRSLSNPKASSLKGWQAIYDIGNRTFGCNFIAPNGKFDDDRSVTYDGSGVSLFRQWVADEAGIDNAEDPAFIEAIATGADSYQPMGSSFSIPLGEARATATEWYLGQLEEHILESTPAEIETSGIGGGGAYDFGHPLLEELRGDDRYVVSEPDIANVSAQLVMMAREIR
jgi:hypothetical protein